jgi:hypothetical protein
LLLGSPVDFVEQLKEVGSFEIVFELPQVVKLVDLGEHLIIG